MLPADYRPPRPIYSKWFWKDLLAKTHWMSAAGLGAYIRILGYMVTVSPDFCSAPDDDSVLARVAGLGTKTWQKVRPEVIAQLELTDAGRFISRRLREDATVWANHCYLQYLRRTGGGPTVDRMPTGCPPDADHTRAREMSDIRSQKEEKITPPSPPRAPRSVRPAEPDGFAELYDAFPKHVGRFHAAKAYRAALAKAEPEILLAGALRYAESVAGKDQQFTQAPAAWLNGGRWMDEPAHGKPDLEAAEWAERERRAIERHGTQKEPTA